MLKLNIKHKNLSHLRIIHWFKNLTLRLLRALHTNTEYGSVFIRTNENYKFVLTLCRILVQFLTLKQIKNQNKVRN